MNLYSYSGPVMRFDKCVNDSWQGSTYAVSEREAKKNLAYKYKKNNNLIPNAKIELTGKVYLVQSGG